MSEGEMSVIDIKPKQRKRASRPLPPEQTNDSARAFGRLARGIQTDLGGARQLTKIELELINAFSGAAVCIHYFNRQIVLGEGSEVDLASFAVLASTMLRIGSRLGLARRSKPVPTLSDYLRSDYPRDNGGDSA